MVANKDTIIYKLDANPTTASSKKKTNIKISIINILYLSIIHKIYIQKPIFVYQNKPAYSPGKTNYEYSILFFSILIVNKLKNCNAVTLYC